MSKHCKVGISYKIQRGVSPSLMCSMTPDLFKTCLLIYFYRVISFSKSFVSLSGRVNKDAESRRWNDLVHGSGRLQGPVRMREVPTLDGLESRTPRSTRPRDGLHLSRGNRERAITRASRDFLSLASATLYSATSFLITCLSR